MKRQKDTSGKTCASKRCSVRTYVPYSIRPGKLDGAMQAARERLGAETAHDPFSLPA